MVEMVVLDLDDTLYLEQDYVFSGFRAIESWAIEHGMPGLGSTCADLFNAGTRGRIFDLAVEELKISEGADLVGQLVEVYRNHGPDIGLAPDVAGTLGSLRSAGVPMAMVTGGPVVSQVAKVNALGLSQDIAPIVYARSWGEEFDKPHDRAFAELEARTGLSGRELIYVADNPTKDWPPAKIRGWEFARIKRVGSVHQDIATPAGIREYGDIAAWYSDFSRSRD